jgi:hypothetical protein
LLPGKEPLVPIEYEARWAPEPVVRRKIPSPLPGLEPPIIQPVSQRYTAELSWLLATPENSK